MASSILSLANSSLSIIPLVTDLVLKTIPMFQKKKKNQKSHIHVQVDHVPGHVLHAAPLQHSTTTSPPPLSQVEQARTNKAELAALLEQVALLETKQELLEQQTELDDLRCAVAEMEENERGLLGEVSSI